MLRFYFCYALSPIENGELFTHAIMLLCVCVVVRTRAHSIPLSGTPNPHPGMKMEHEAMYEKIGYVHESDANDPKPSSITKRTNTSQEQQLYS